MKKLARKYAMGEWELDPSHLPEAAERLARFEELPLELEAELASISAELETLRRERKQKTVRFRELMAKKLTDRSLLLRLEEAGLTGQ